MITRRQFLKRVGTVCAAVVVAPTVLVKKKPQKPIVGNRAKQMFIGSRRIVILDEFAKMDGYNHWHEWYMNNSNEETNKSR
jgi:hypothetical protein